jgi:uncharacterized damage-inducible protein DinB
MQVETIRSMHEYNRWANERVLECVARLHRDHFVEANDTPWGSIRNQQVHMFSVHRSWLSWADGSMSGEEAYALTADPEDYPDAEAVRAYWNDVWTQTDEFLKRMSVDDLTRVLSAEGPGFAIAIPVWQVMVHIANHSMQHRTETAMALTRLGQSPGDLDYIFYAFEENARVAQ